MTTSMYRWIEERLALARFRERFVRKPFPVHHSFFLGEIALFAFLTLVVTGAFLVLNYEGSARPVKLAGEMVPAAYASIQYIDSLPLGRVMRGAHHWSAHVMIAAAFLHLLRVALTGAYKRPRELNWLIGLALLVAAVVTSFTGYSLPNDAFAVTATTIGYGIASALPWIGSWAAQVMFGGEYPTAHSLPRLLAAHVFWMPSILVLLTAAHLIIMVKQKHTQPVYARRVAPGRILGMPLWPEQLVTMLVLLFVYLGVIFAVAGVFPIHPVEVFGPPTAATPQVKPDWYFLWVYGLLQLIPSSWSFELLGTRFGPELWGGIVLPALVGLLAILPPFIDRERTDLSYVELPSQHPLRTALTTGVVSFLAVAAAAGYRDWLELPIWLFWALLLVVPPVVTVLVFGIVRTLSRRAPGEGTPLPSQLAGH